MNERRRASQVPIMLVVGAIAVVACLIWFSISFTGHFCPNCHGPMLKNVRGAGWHECMLCGQLLPIPKAKE